jgi:hypothetical protein
MLCGNTNIPAPKLCVSLPDGSNLSMGARLEPAQVLALHRSNTQTLPRASTSTALVDPHVLSSFAQPCSDEYEVRSSGAGGARIMSAHPQTIATAAQVVTIVRDEMPMAVTS